MAMRCPQCGAENDDDAKYCDQCAAQLSVDSTAGATGKSRKPAGGSLTSSPINWMALFLVAAVVGALIWLLVPHKQDPHLGDGAASMSGGMAGGAGEGNPHLSGGNDGTGPMDTDITKQLDDAKAALKKDPLDIAALGILYRMYGTIGRQQQVRPYLDAAYAELVKQRPQLGAKAVDTLVELVSEAMLGGDGDGALSILEQYQQLEPHNTALLGILGDVCFDMDKRDDAIKWYTLYLNQIHSEPKPEQYWRVRADRARMYLSNGRPADRKLALSELEIVTQQYPALWNAWFYLGLAYKTAGRTDAAKQTWLKASETATNELDKWQAQAELAKLEGKEPPPQPANPHGQMGMPGEDPAHEHGGGDPRNGKDAAGGRQDNGG